MYNQCFLVNGPNCMTTWIDEKFAKAGKIVSVKVDGEWDDGWSVVKVYDYKITRGELLRLQRQANDTRKASDI